MSAIFESKLNRVLASLALAGVVMALVSYSYVQLKQAQVWTGPTITVTGKGEVSAKPDTAQFSFNVRAEGKDAAEAQTKSATAINDITTYLKDNGVEEADIKTEGYNLSPKYKYEQKACAFGMYCPPGEQVQDGFEVFQTVTVKVRNIEKAGELLANVGSKGATDISGLTFTVGDEDKLKADVRNLAIEDAKKQAEIIADKLGVNIVKVTSYYEDLPIMDYHGGVMMETAMVKSADAVVPEIPAGETKTTSSVSVTFEIR